MPQLNAPPVHHQPAPQPHAHGVHDAAGGGAHQRGPAGDYETQRANQTPPSPTDAAWQSVLQGRVLLARGSRNKAVEAAQARLNKAGHRVAVDGDFGKLTERAVRAFQAASRLSADGVIGPATASALDHAGSAPAPAPAPPRPHDHAHGEGGHDASWGAWGDVRSGRLLLRNGSQGAAVRALQTQLVAAGHAVTVDGRFGGGTAAAVRSLQIDHELAPDGVVGAGTAAAIEAEVAWQRVVRGEHELGDGAGGPAVQRMQQLLTRAGHGVQRTGRFGPTTRQQVLAFQKAHELETTGRVGATTAKALQKAVPGVSGPTQRHQAWDNGQRAGVVETVTIDGKPVEKKTAAAYLRMRAAAERDGVYISIVSGFRTYEEQAHLRRLYEQGRGNLAAQPGYSNHQDGRAVDLNTADPGVYRWLTRHAGAYGFKRTVPSEDWHWEYWP